ncbi:hypothetical protein A500_07796 [Clostridium sartagoforme AAU1]|uniref:ABC3 transporter permease C-terminal domain-containing protein n=1 Tax=Clostridium sartagoforme AAU1 TaxID=1202534 RepID=R9CGZ4_9CLOT|nr:ABC transporter permease [Clostridium sartagoforme]EOR26461.1 hypothetical protein A500_07796 [Clostridium sartagoforme AAU1]
MFKFLLKRKSINMFFILAFTFTIITFSLGNSIILNQEELINKFSPDKNKIIVFKLENDISISDVVGLIKDKEITVDLRFYDNKSEAYIESEFIIKSFSTVGELKEGNLFNSEDYLSQNNIYIASSAFNEEEVSLMGYGSERYEFEKIGSFYDTTKRIIVPNDSFIKLLGENKINSPYLNIIISGEEESINSSIDILTKYIKEIDNKNNLEVFSYMKENRKVEAESLYKDSILIVIITLINSLTLSSLWVESRKKELALRKAVGGTSKQLMKLFFNEMFYISIISLILAFAIHYIVFIISGGYIENLSVAINIKGILYSMILTVIVAVIITLPSIFYLSGVRPSVILRGE